MNLKQKYLHLKGPSSFNFDQERQIVFQKILHLVASYDKNSWQSCKLNFQSYIESYKQIYGLTSLQKETLIFVFSNIFLCDSGCSVHIKITILRLLNLICEFNIAITNNLSFNNQLMLNIYKNMANEGTKTPLKHTDSYLEQLSKFVIYSSKYGEDCTESALQFAIERRDLKYMALFVRSLKTNSAAERVMEEIFVQNSIWDRDVTWFFIVSQITQNFPSINYNPYYQSLFQEIIKIITTLIDPISKEEVDKITQKQLCLGLRSILKSGAQILANLVLPSNLPHSMHIWSCVERIFNIISTSLDHINLTSFINDFFTFVKTFVKCFLNKYRKERNMYKPVNEDDIKQYQDTKEFVFKLDDLILKKFYLLWPEIIPKFLLFEDGQCRLPKILSDLAMYDPQSFLPIILKAMIELLSKEELSMTSLYTTKMTIFFIQEFILTECSADLVGMLLQCCSLILKVINKLGISQHLDFLELVMRMFSFLGDEEVEDEHCQSIIHECIQIILSNLQAMSIALEAAQNQQNQIYVDFRNIYFTFFIRLTSSQINNFSYRFLDSILEVIPTHRLAYELITVLLAYINPKFSQMLLNSVSKQLLTQPKVNNSLNIGNNLPFLPQPTYQLLTTNEEHIRWYTSLLQCCYQHHPSHIIRDWNKLESIILLLLKKPDNNSFFEWGLDILYNIIICLVQFHVDYKEFFKTSNSNYQSIDVKWIKTSEQAESLIEEIYQRFYVNAQNYVRKKYQGKQYKKKCEDVKIGEIIINGQFLDQVDSILTPSQMKNQVLEQIKILSKILQLQEAVFGGILPRLATRSDSPIYQFSPSIFLKKYDNLRKQCSQYLEWLFKVLQQFDALWLTAIMKYYHSFWREIHEEAAFSQAISATNQKLTQYFYPYEHKKKQIFGNSFMILNEMYLLHYMRIQLHHDLYPNSEKINQNYLAKHFLFQMFYSDQECSSKCYVNSSSDVHYFHQNIIGLFRLKLDPKEINSYANLYKNAESVQAKEKYLKAIRQLLLSIKKTNAFFSLEMCLRDSFIRDSTINILGLSKVLEQKKQKKIVLETFYLKLLFNLEISLIYAQKTYLFWDEAHWSNNRVSIVNKNILKAGNFTDCIKSMSQQNIEALNIKTYSQIQSFMNSILKILQKSNQKDSIIYMLILTLYSDLLTIKDPILLKIITVSIKMCETRKIAIVDMGRTAFFHVIYRFAKHKQITKYIPNTPIKRPFEQYLIFRLLGGYPGIDYLKVKCQRLDTYFYPLRQLRQIAYIKLGQDVRQDSLQNQIGILQILNNVKVMENFFLCCTEDNELKQIETEFDASLLGQSPKSMMQNGHKLLNYALDSNPQKIDIFQTFIQNFSLYPVFFYQRLVEKLVRLGNQETIQALKQISKTLLKHSQIQYHKLSLYIFSEILPSLLNDKPFMDEFIQYFSTCSNQIFSFALNCLYFLFCTNFMISAKIYRSLILRLREEKGSSRLRHLQVLNTFMLAQGRFSKNEAKQAIGYLLQGIQEGSNEIAEAIVTMIISCFIIAINLQTFEQWVEQPLYELVQSKRIYKLNNRVGFEIDSSLKTIIQVIISKAKKQEQVNEVSTNLKPYSKIANQILGSITVHRFNNTFYEMLKDLIMYVIQKPSTMEKTDDQIISQLKDSQYPENIYQDLVQTLSKMENNTPNVVKKKLKYLESVIINHSFVMNKVQLPNILFIDQKNITLDHILLLSNIARVMTPAQLTLKVQKALKSELPAKVKQGLLMSYLNSAGVKSYQWKETVLKEILKSKKKKLVKEFISMWWKGKNQHTEQEQRLHRLVMSVENPYSYFA